jgi:hypothetical protein
MSGAIGRFRFRTTRPSTSANEQPPARETFSAGYGLASLLLRMKRNPASVTSLPDGAEEVGEEAVAGGFDAGIVLH